MIETRFTNMLYSVIDLINIRLPTYVKPKAMLLREELRCDRYREYSVTSSENNVSSKCFHLLFS